VLGLLNLGFTTAEMATALNVTAGTVRWHLNHIFAKLHVRNRTEAIVKARESKLL
jgi:ATP/maltotriose-dependent transcriptional regulator MalT